MVRRTEVLQGLRLMTFLSLLDRVEAAELSKLEAAGILGVSERTFRRWCGRYREEGEAGLFDRRLGKASAKREAVNQCAPQAGQLGVLSTHRRRAMTRGGEVAISA
jgi:transposase